LSSPSLPASWRVRRRSGKNRARVAVARKLAGICWVRLRRWHRAQAHEAAAAPALMN